MLRIDEKEYLKEELKKCRRKYFHMANTPLAREYFEYAKSIYPEAKLFVTMSSGQFITITKTGEKKVQETLLKILMDRTESLMQAKLDYDNSFVE